MYQDKKILVGMSGEEKVYIYPKMANRHGMIAGATGTGKTVTLKVMAESFSACGVPVFLADVKGDLAGMCRMGTMNKNVKERVDAMGLDDLGFNLDKFPTTYWDVYAEKGLPLRTTISEMGPLLLSRILGLNNTQTDIMSILFKVADDNGLLLIDIKDLRALLQFAGENAKELSLEYGNMSKQSLAAIIRAIVALESQGGDLFFGEPALNIADWFGTDCDGKGHIQVLDCQKLINFPTMYSTFLLWMMSELFETLPEAGDREKPKMVFFFDEAHMLFDNASKALLERIAQVVKLIRSKGVGIYFITQNPRDIPDEVLAQLGNKVQHALHAYTPAEQKAAKAVSMSFRENPEFDTYDTLLNLGIGEALVSVLDEKGVPTIVKRTNILPPQSQMGPITDEERDSEVKGSLLYLRYNDYYDRDSAYEFLQRKSVAAAETARKEAEEEAARQAEEKELIAQEKEAKREALRVQKASERAEAAKKKQTDKLAKSVVNSAGSTIGREIGNNIGKSIGGKFGKKLGGNIGATLGRGVLSTLFKF